MSPIGKELSAKENAKPAQNFKTFMNVFRPIREWLQQTRQPKSSTPISAPILRSSSTNAHLRNRTIDNGRNLHGNNVVIRNMSNSKSYSGGSLTGSSGDMLSSANPTPTHQQHHSTLNNRFTPIPNGYGGPIDDGNTGGGTMLNSLEDQLDNSVRLEGMNEVSGIGSTLDINQQFSRASQARMSLPIMQQNKIRRQAYSQMQRRGQHHVSSSMGHIYLQHKGETKQASLPNELTTIDTIRALFVCAFPHMLTMEYMSQQHVKIYIYNPSCNIFYELCDIEDVRHESVLRIHQSEPFGHIGLRSQVSMSSLGVPVAPIAQQHNPYHTLHRMPPRMPPNMMTPIPQQQHQQKQQQQQPQTQQQQPHQTSAMLSHSMMQQPMMGPQHIQQQPVLHQIPAPLPHLSQIPPPKPRRMVPSSYSMHRLQAHPTQ